MPILQGLIFDLDGTLIDSAPDLRQALNATLKQHGRRELTLDEAQDLIGDGMLPMLGRAFSMTGASLSDSQTYEHFQEFIHHYRNLKPDPSQLFPHSTQCLEDLKQRGVALGICTNKHEASTLRLLEDLEVRHYFDCVAGGDTFVVHKPHPDHVLGVIRSLKVPTNACAMIGDSHNDVASAQGAGIPCIVVTHGYGTKLEELGANAIMKTFKDLEQTLSSLGFELPRRK